MVKTLIIDNMRGGISNFTNLTKFTDIKAWLDSLERPTLIGFGNPFSTY